MNPIATGPSDVIPLNHNPLQLALNVRIHVVVGNLQLSLGKLGSLHSELCELKLGAEHTGNTSQIHWDRWILGQTIQRLLHPVFSDHIYADLRIEWERFGTGGRHSAS